MKLKDFRLATDLLPDDLELQFLATSGDCWFLDGLVHLPDENLLVLGADQAGLHEAIEESDLNIREETDQAKVDAIVLSCVRELDDEYESCAEEGGVCHPPTAPSREPEDFEAL